MSALLKPTNQEGSGKITVNHSVQILMFRKPAFSKNSKKNICDGMKFLRSCTPSYMFSQQVFFFSLHKKWSFLLRISSVNVTKSAGNCGSGHIYWKKS